MLKTLARGAARTLKSTVLADPQKSANCTQPNVQSGGFNLESGDSCGLTGAADLVKTDPGLRGLADNGGPTQTMAIGLQSPALDAGVDGSVKADQRGFDRPVRIDNVPKPEGGDGTDIGAYELQQGVGGGKRGIDGTVRPRRVVAGEKSCVVFKARRTDGRRTMGLLRGVAIRFAGETKTTGGHGKARFCVEFPKAGKRTARFTKRAFEPDRARVRVLPG